MHAGPIIAIDIDLHRVHAVLSPSLGGCPTIICVNEPSLDLVRSRITDELTTFPMTTVLIEVADPTTYGGLNQRGRLAWMIWNTYAATQLAMNLGRVAAVYVNPSSKWTKGFPEAVRHKMAGVVDLTKNKAKNHDLNECQAMIWFFRNEPENWPSLTSYFRDLGVTRRLRPVGEQRL